VTGRNSDKDLSFLVAGNIFLLLQALHFVFSFFSRQQWFVASLAIRVIGF